MSLAPYDASAHIDWLLGLPEFAVLRGPLASDGRRQRGERLPRRELLGTEPEFRSQRDRRWLGRLNVLAGLLPRSLGEVVRVVVMSNGNPSALLEIRSAALTVGRRSRLQTLCLKRLKNREDQVRDPFTAAERKNFERLLLSFGQVRVEGIASIADDAPLTTLRAVTPGIPIHVHATMMDNGHLVAGASAAGWPRLGEASSAQPVKDGRFRFVLRLDP